MHNVSGPLRAVFSIALVSFDLFMEGKCGDGFA